MSLEAVAVAVVRVGLVRMSRMRMGLLGIRHSQGAPQPARSPRAVGGCSQGAPHREHHDQEDQQEKAKGFHEGLTRLDGSRSSELLRGPLCRRTACPEWPLRASGFAVKRAPPGSADAGMSGMIGMHMQMERRMAMMEQMMQMMVDREAGRTGR